MKQYIFIIILSCVSIFGYSQTVDTIFTTPIYKSYFCKTYKQPLFVTYKLYRGGGDISRDGMSFKGVKGVTATSANYAHTPYDKGHLVNAEDFANNIVNLELTFRYYNCLPQSKNLNRGIWKKQENRIRVESNTDSLLIICGGYDFKLIGKLYVPTYCFKIVKNLRTDKITHVMIFTNNINDNTMNEYNMNILITKSTYKMLTNLVK